MNTLLLVEDDTSLGATLNERLVLEGYTVVWNQDVSTAKLSFEQNEFDLLILDVGLIGGDGFEFAKWVKSRSLTPFLFMTAMHTAEYRLKGFELGAEDYIPKPFHLKEILLRIKHILETHIHEKVVKIGKAQVDFRQHLVTFKEQKTRLALKDVHILKLLVEASPSVVSREEILNKVWGESKFPTERTVDNSILRIRQALGDTTGQLVKSVRGVGYLLEKGL